MSAGDTESPSSEVEARVANRSSANGAAPKDAAKTQASITELELQFAQNPESGAFIDLCEAYLRQGRFMEAMVVCKKGIKAHPDAVDGRILLARVYAEQKKYKRALTELDKLADEHAESGAVFLARGRVRIDSGAKDDGLADLKLAVDKDASLTEASELLAEHGITYPEPEPEPEPPPRVGPPPAPPMSVDIASQDLAPPPRAASMVPRGASGIQITPVTPPFGVGPSSSTGDLPVPGTGDLPPFGAHAPRPQSGGHAPLPRSNSVLPGRANSVVPQILEGEEELEKIAQAVAAEKPDRGRPKTTLILVVALTLVGLGIAGQRLLAKSRIEGIDLLTTKAVPAFNRDTYGSYKAAAGYFEEILDDYDDDHPLTLGRLAHTYAILWGEHGETDLEPKLKAILARAEEKAPTVSHTVAARALAALYEGQDRHAAAERAVAIAQPYIQENAAGGAAPTHADIAVALADLQLGEYEEATKTLGRVKEVLPGSVRAKVWHARAAFRARRVGAAIASFSAALRAEPNHPGALAGLALARLERGNLDLAAADLLRFDQLAREQPKNISPRDQAMAEFARSEIMRSAGEDAKATGAYEQALRLDPQNAHFPFALGRWLLEQDRAKEAIEPLENAVKMEPYRWAFHVELAEARMRNGQYDDAKKHIEDALARAPNDSEALIARARYLRRTKQPNTEPYLKELLEKHPTMAVDVHLELGRHYRSLNRLDDAKNELEEAIKVMERHPVAKQADVLISYGRLMDDRGEEGVAANAYKRAAEFGALEGWYRLAINLAKSRSDPELLKKSCDEYLAAGNSLRYSRSARQLCDSLR